MTLNQVIQRLETLALSHKQVNHFFFGSPDDWFHTGEVSYPACFIDLVDSSISKEDRQTVFTLKILFCDAANVADKSKNNEVEVLSDLHSIYEDYLAMVMFTDYRDWDITPVVGLQNGREEFEDIVIGVWGEVKVGVRYDADRCKVPSSLNFENDKDMINNYIYKGSGSEGTGFSTTVLQYKTILLVMKGDKVLTPTTGTPSVNEYVYNETTGGFTFGNAIENGQIIQILNRNLG